MKSLRLLFILLYCLSCSMLQAQDNFDMGIITPAEMNPEPYRQKYPDASAVILSSITDYKWQNRGKNNLIFTITVKQRLMVLRESGLEYGDISIPYFNQQGTGESVFDFRANVYNLNGNRIEQKRIRKHDGFTRSGGNNWYEMVFALPGVKVGSVIEYTYELDSDFIFEPRKWVYQKDIPVVYAQLNFKKPEFINHLIGKTGNQTPYLRRTELTPSRYALTVPVESRPGEYSSFTHRFNENSKTESYAVRDIPAFRHEPLVDNPGNYTGSFFYLPVEEDPSRWNWIKQDTLDTWARINRQILEFPNFNGYYEMALEAVTPWLADTVGIPADSLIHWALETVHRKVSWNGQATIRAGAPPEDVLALGYGNIAEVNLILMALVRKMGYWAFPVLLSTTDNGSIHYDMPSIRQWNYVVVRVTDKKSPEGGMLLDASPQYPMPGYLPDRAINGRGLQVNEAVTRWICLEENTTYREKKHYELFLHPNGDISGTMELFLEDFGKFTWTNFLDIFGQEGYWQILENETGLQFTNRFINTNARSAEPFHVKADVFIPAYTQAAGREIILPALLVETLESNPFRTEDRVSPVVFNYLLDAETSINLHYPQNHTLTYLPEKISDAWQTFTYAYEWEHADNQVQIRAKTQRGMRRIDVEQYGAFREFALRRIYNNNDSLVFEITDAASSEELTDNMPK